MQSIYNPIMRLSESHTRSTEGVYVEKSQVICVHIYFTSLNGVRPVIYIKREKSWAKKDLCVIGSQHEVAILSSISDL